MTVISACRSPRQEDHEFKANLGYIVRLCVSKENSVSNPNSTLNKKDYTP
jgi:hypothetical protein